MSYINTIPNIVKITHDDIFKEPAEKKLFWRSEVKFSLKGWSPKFN